jgi:hypothetical protein
MLNNIYNLEHGEYVIERYRVKVTELLDSGWAQSVPWLKAIITNRRLLLVPEEREASGSPINIPLSDIEAVWNVGLGRRDGVVFGLKGGEKLHMLVDWNQGRRLLRDTQTVMALSPNFSPHFVM